MWGERDRDHPGRPRPRRRTSVIPASRFEIFQDAGHFPHRDEPRRFVQVLADFIDSTEPAHVEDDDFRELLRGRTE